MVKYELIDSAGNVIASNMSDETVFLFAKTYMNDFDQVTIKRIYVEEKFLVEETKKEDIIRNSRDKASAYVKNVIKEEVKKVVEDNRESINVATEDIDITSIFE